MRHGLKLLPLATLWPRCWLPAWRPADTLLQIYEKAVQQRPAGAGGRGQQAGHPGRQAHRPGQPAAPGQRPLQHQRNVRRRRNGHHARQRATGAARHRFPGLRCQVLVAGAAPVGVPLGPVGPAVPGRQAVGPGGRGLPGRPAGPGGARRRRLLQRARRRGHPGLRAGRQGSHRPPAGAGPEALRGGPDRHHRRAGGPGRLRPGAGRGDPRQARPGQPAGSAAHDHRRDAPAARQARGEPAAAQPRPGGR